jgi:uncharacterized protein YdeI (YjbR/CyaY-like superfamily)
MAKSAENPDVDFFFAKADKWRAAFEALRVILLGCGLDESLKWGVPCYAVEGGNVVLMHGFKDYCAVLFFKGALLEDPAGVLVQQTKNVQAGRQIRFTSAGEVAKLAAVLKDYVKAAIELEKSGAKVGLKTIAQFAVPEEFRLKLEGDPALNEAFEALTPGRRRAYLLHFSAPKQAKTREARIEKAAPRILEGMGLDD